MVYICDNCHRNCSSKQRLNTFILNQIYVLKREDKLICADCNRKFANNNGYKYHIEHNVCKKKGINDVEKIIIGNRKN